MLLLFYKVGQKFKKFNLAQKLKEGWRDFTN
jgi:hypothetical protein